MFVCVFWQFLVHPCFNDHTLEPRAPQSLAELTSIIQAPISNMHDNLVASLEAQWDQD